MEVIVATHAGACYGVKRALQIALETAAGGGACETLGPIIHNPKVVARLEDAGVRAAAGLDDLRGDTVIVRSHGVVPAVSEELARRCSCVVDATCPHVSRAQKAALELAREGRCVLVIGEEGHPEVESLREYARLATDDVHVVARVDELPVELSDPLGIVVQTTQNADVLDAIVDELHARGLNPLVKNTICSATTKRQDAVTEIAADVDAFVVIGGRNSSNTTRLFEIASQLAPRAFHVEDAAELVPAQFAGCTRVGVSAGASTPQDQIDEVVARLESF